MYAIDLFCGAGGMAEGILQAGFQILFASDLNADVEKTYTNRKQQLGYIQGTHYQFHRGDIRDLTGEMIWDAIQNLDMFQHGLSCPSEIDAIFGGPPCQGFSRAGKRDVNDPRNLLFREYLRVISEVRPKYVVMENVEGIRDLVFPSFNGISGHTYYDQTVPVLLEKELNQIGYQLLTPKTLNAADYGVPQNRKRVIFLAYREDQSVPRYPEPIMKKKRTLEDAIIDGPYRHLCAEGRTPSISGIPIKETNPKNLELSKHNSIIEERFSLYNEGETTAQLRKRIVEYGVDLSFCPSLISFLSIQTGLAESECLKLAKEGNVDETFLNLLLTKKQIRKKLKRLEPSPTITTMGDDFISPYTNQAFSVRDLARIQSFDDSFVFLGKRTTGGKRRRTDVPQYTQVGNAVPPLLARAIALEIKQCLEGKR